jgi:ectoine hydroxylase-related dioxygenase (phytanoyl-CoA dioxygenase family)
MNYKKELINNGFSILDDVYSTSEIEEIIKCIENQKKEGETFLKSTELFAIRQLLNTIPNLKKLLFNKNLIELLSTLFDSTFFLTKAIYFDKPKESNWFVPYHQDISISVNKKLNLKGYKNWTFKKGQYGVQPPNKILEDTITVRVHLDKTDSNNGALKVIPNSHLNGVIRINSNEFNTNNEQFCEVEKGGIMLMKPLLFHASNRSDNSNKRRVIHLEFNKRDLPDPLEWLEYSYLMPSNKTRVSKSQ